MTTKITDAMRECCDQIRRHATCTYGFEMLSRCVSAGLLENEDGADLSDPFYYACTARGNDAADEYAQKRADKRAKTNANARSRSEAMKSLGMVRTRSGGWE